MHPGLVELSSSGHVNFFIIYFFIDSFIKNVNKTVNLKNKDSKGVQGIRDPSQVVKMDEWDMAEVTMKKFLDL